MIPFKRVKPALGTFFEISMTGLPKDIFLTVTSQAFEDIYRLEKIFNVFDSESELSKINKEKVGKESAISNELRAVLEFGLKIEMASKRAFKLIPNCEHTGFLLSGNRLTKTTSSYFDLGGIAKGYIVDFIYDRLLKAAPESVILVNSGGDLRSNGWTYIEVRVPTSDDEKRFALKYFRGALATSSLAGSNLNVGHAAGKYKYSLTPDTVALTNTVMVGAKTCMEADALTKAYLFGETKTHLPGFCPILFKIFDGHGAAL